MHALPNSAKRRRQLDDRLLRQFGLAAEIMGFQDFVYIARAVPGDGRYLRRGARQAIMMAVLSLSLNSATKSQQTG